MPNGNDDWSKYKVKATSDDWEKYKVISKESATPAKSTSKISPRPAGVGTWLENFEGDVRTGTGATWIGRLMKKMGAPGIETGVSKEAGEFAGSPLLGTVHAAQGISMLPHQPWEGTKKAVGGAMEALTIPGLLEAGPSEAGTNLLAKGEGILKARKAAKVAEKSMEEWKKINKVLGVSSKAIRIGEEAKNLGEAATLPGRSLEKAGFTAKKLEKMKPLERMKAIRPYVQQAGEQIEQVLKEHEKAGKVFDVGAKATEIIKRIPNPRIQEAALDAFVDLTKELGIQNQRAATPTEAWKLRRALVAGARFGSGGDLNSLSNVRGALYGAVSGDLKAAVPELEKLDPLYSDLKEAAKAARNQVKSEASKGSKPGLLKSLAKGAKKEFTERPIRSTALALGIPYVGREVVRYAVPGKN